MNLVVRALPIVLWLAACDGPRHDEIPDALEERVPQVDEGTRDLALPLRALLRAPDVVIDDERLSAIAAPDAIAAICEELLADPTLSRYEQTRLVSALRWVDHPQAEVLLERVLQRPETSVFVRRVAVKAHAHRAGARALPLLARFADDDDRHTREAVIRALATIDGQAAKRLLVERRVQDPAPDLRALATRLSTPR